MDVWTGFLRSTGLVERSRIRSSFVRRSGSPWYGYNVPAIAATATLDNSLAAQFPQARKYGYCDEVEIVNNDVVDILVQFNGTGNTGFLIPAGTIWGISDTAIRQWRITNQDAVNASTLGSIRVTMRRMPETADTQARGKQHEVRG